MPQAMATGTLNTLTAHYSDYFADREQLEWCEIMAPEKAGNIMAICSSVPHDTILDIGAGDGAVMRRLEQANFGSAFYAVDISESGLAALRRQPPRRLEESQLFDGYAIPYPDSRFDLAILSHVVEHVEHPRILLREAARVARSVYVEVPLEFTLLNRRLRRDFQMDSTGHINFFNPMLIRLLVQSAGLRILRQEVRHYAPKVYVYGKGRRGLINYWIKEIALRLSPRLATTIFNYHFGLVCTADRSQTHPPT